MKDAIQIMERLCIGENIESNHICYKVVFYKVNSQDCKHI